MLIVLLQIYRGGPEEVGLGYGTTTDDLLKLSRMKLIERSQLRSSTYRCTDKCR